MAKRINVIIQFKEGLTGLNMSISEFSETSHHMCHISHTFITSLWWMYVICTMITSIWKKIWSRKHQVQANQPAGWWCNKCMCRTHSVPGQSLGPVLVNDLDITWRLDPGFSIHLNWHAFITQDGDLYCPTLRWTKEVRQADRWTESNTKRNTDCKQEAAPVQCGDAAGWLLGTQPSACCQTPPPPPGSYHQRKEQWRSEEDR